MRLIFTDEAGSSKDQPIVAVAAIIVREGDELALLESEISRIITDRVPLSIREGFHIHATDIFSGKKGLRYIWSEDERIDFLKEIACLPFVHDVPVAISYAQKASFPELREQRKGGRKLTSDQLNHLLMFNQCMEAADLFLRKYLDGSEKGKVVAEAASEMTGMLKEHGLIYRDIRITVPPSGQRMDLVEDRLNEPLVERIYNIEHIIDQPQFFRKGEASVLQIADVIAFSFRRFAAQLTHGSDLVDAILGPEEGPAVTSDPVWQTSTNHGLFITDKYVDDETRAYRQFRRRVAQGNIIVIDGSDPQRMQNFEADRDRWNRLSGAHGLAPHGDSSRMIDVSNLF